MGSSVQPFLIASVESGDCQCLADGPGLPEIGHMKSFTSLVGLGAVVLMVVAAMVLPTLLAGKAAGEPAHEASAQRVGP